MAELDPFSIFVIGLLIAIGIAFVVVLIRFFVVATRQRAVARAAGLDTVEGQAAALRGLTDSMGTTAAPVAPPAAAPVAQPAAQPQTIEARLTELRSLRDRGVITTDEYDAARRRAISGPEQP